MLSELGARLKRPPTEPLAASRRALQAQTVRRRQLVDLRKQAAEAFIAGDAATGKALMRDYINATIGFYQLGQAVAMDPKNLMRMFGPRGNSRLTNLPSVLCELTRREAIQFKVEPDRLVG